VPAAVYKARDDEGGVINVPPAANSLNLLLRDEGLMRFVKYVSAGERLPLAAVLLLPVGEGAGGRRGRTGGSHRAAVCCMAPLVGRNPRASQQLGCPAGPFPHLLVHSD